MHKHMSRRGTVLMVAVIAAWMGGWVPAAVAKNAFVEVTGQTESFAEGDDGEIQAGVPFPSPRFKDQDDGTVKDNLTDLIWLKNADCFGGVVWQATLTAANTLHDTGTPSTMDDCGLSDGSEAGDWRLPNIKELQSLIDFGFIDPPLSNAAGTAKWTEGNAFSNVQPGAGYWSSTTFAGDSDVAWVVGLGDGRTVGLTKDNTVLVWPVRGGK